MQTDHGKRRSDCLIADVLVSSLKVESWVGLCQGVVACPCTCCCWVPCYRCCMLLRKKHN